MHAIGKRLIIVFLTLVVSGCGVIPYRTARNEPDCRRSEIGPRPCEDVKRASISYSTNEPLPPAFVGLSLSGGGSRAANFSMGVMQNLDEMGILKHVTAISSTSGGGLAAAYYALNGRHMDWQLAKSKMGTNFLAKWAAKVFSPQNILSVAMTHEDRSDLMADVFDEVLFDNATYVDLDRRWPTGPRFYANATSVGDGKRFPITASEFTNINSRLDTYPVSQAVMSSAAFPGVFNSVTLRRFKTNSPLDNKSKSSYLHLLDGGPSDNLGIESILEAAAQFQAALKVADRPPAPCFLILVDAYPSVNPDRLANSADPRGIADHLVDTNFMDAFDALLSRRRLDTLQRFGLGPGVVTQREGAFNYAEWQSMDRGLATTPVIKVVTFDYPIFRDKRQIGAAIPADLLKQFVPPESLSNPPSGHFRCTAWHLDLSEMDASDYVSRADGSVSRRAFIPPGPKDDLQQRWRLGRVVRNIETNFHLTGPNSCKSEVLQDALYAAAHLVTRQDWDNTQKACNWFTRTGLDLGQACSQYPGGKVKMDYEELERCAAK